MTCAACQAFVQKTLASHAGVRDASVNLMLHNATVTFDPRITSIPELVEEIRATGYGATEPVSGRSVLAEQQRHDTEQLDEYRRSRVRAIVTMALGVIAMLFSMPLMSMRGAGALERMKDPLIGWSMRTLDPLLRRAVPGIYAFNDDAIRWFLFALSVLVVSWSGRRFYSKAWAAVRHRTADMNTLVALGSGAAFVYSAAATISPRFFLGHGIAPDV